MHANFSVQQILDVAALVAGGVWLLKKIVNMQRFHELRVLLLTVLLSSTAIYLFIVLSDAGGFNLNNDCVIEVKGGVYPYTEE